MDLRKHIPNSITALNLLCGCGAIYSLLVLHEYSYATVFVLLACVFDFLDGMMARLLKAYSELGKQMDSLADMISFGVVPGFALFMLLNDLRAPQYVSLLAFLITVFSAFRLAKFNIDTRQSENFIGLPTPACALFCLSIAFYFVKGNPYSVMYQLLFGSWIPLLLVALCLSYLLVAELPMFSLKVKHLTWKDNKIRIYYLLSILLLVGFLGLAGIVLIIPVYILFSIGKTILSR